MSKPTVALTRAETTNAKTTDACSASGVEGFVMCFLNFFFIGG
jgi:hypothetical protein